MLVHLTWRSRVICMIDRCLQLFFHHTLVLVVFTFSCTLRFRLRFEFHCLRVCSPLVLLNCQSRTVRIHRARDSRVDSVIDVVRQLTRHPVQCKLELTLEVTRMTGSVDGGLRSVHPRRVGGSGRDEVDVVARSPDDDPTVWRYGPEPRSSWRLQDH
jgi:hypothetical protein